MSSDSPPLVAAEALNAFIALVSPQVENARQTGPLHGIRVAVKDNIDVADLPTTAGCDLLRGRNASRDAPSVARLRDAGALVVGKANMHELALGVTSANAAFGVVRNPRDPARFAGGSSGGTAAAIACGAVDAGLGTDTGGSVRIPAALTGIAGFRPSVGRYPSAGVVPLSPTRDTIGPMARRVADLVALDSVLADDWTPAEPHPGKCRLGVPTRYFVDALHPQTQTAFAQALSSLVAAGITLIDIPDAAFDQVEDEIGFPITLYEAAHTLLPQLERATGLAATDIVNGIRSDDVRGLFANAIAPDAPGRISAAAYRSAMRARDQVVRARYRGIFERSAIAALIFPTTPRPAGLVDGELTRIDRGDGVQDSTFATFVRNTCPGSIAGLPGLTLPIERTTGGLPVGLALDAAWGADRRLLAVGLLVERALSA